MTSTPEEGAPTVFHMADLVAWQKDSVVSRTLVKRDKGTITLFAFDKDSALSEHTAPFDALVHVIDGEAEVTIAGQAYTVTGGEAIILPAGRPHALKARTAFKMLLTMIRS